MKTTRYLIIILSLCLGLTALPRPVLADEYDDSQSHPLRVYTYLIYPVGVATEWLLARPFHALVSSTRGVEYVFGHTPHPPLFKEREAIDVGMSRRTYISRGGRSYRVDRYSTRERVAVPGEGGMGAPGDPGYAGGPGGTGAGGERVIIKEVPVVKTVIKEVPVERQVAKYVEVEKFVFPQIAFRFDSAKLTDLGKGRAYLAAHALKEKKDIVVVIEGHTDNVGTEEYNMALGLRRAESIKNELESLGVEPDRVSVASVGETNPLIPQEASWAHAVNRRVEMRLKTE